MSFHAYANGFQAVPRPGLDRIQDLLSRLGDPQERLRCVHVAGTNGKGSVCMFLDAILRKAGLRVGRYLSPNLKKVNERISVNGEPISDEALSALLSKLEPLAEETEQATGIPPTPFEIWTAAALAHFADVGCDIVVLEVGMGGLLDATNVISSCAAAVITRLDLDHTAFLGNTLGEVAKNKCGIMKPSCPVITLPQEEEAMDVIRACAEEKKCPLSIAATPPLGEFSGIYEYYCDGKMPPVLLSLGGAHQLENAALAVEAAKALGIGEKAILAGLSSASHPARLELLSQDPMILFDGGHNPNGIAALVKSLSRYFPEEEETVVFACMQDKDFLPALRLLVNGRRRFVFTTVQNNPRAMGAEALCGAAAEGGILGAWRETLTDAIALATSYGKPVLICGSLYLYGDLPEELDWFSRQK